MQPHVSSQEGDKGDFTNGTAGDGTTEAETGVMRKVKECRQPLETGRVQEQRILPRASRGSALFPHLDFSPEELIADFWPPVRE